MSFPARRKKDDSDVPSALVIDDHPETLLELSDLAGRCGFEVETADDARSARKLLRRQLPEVVLLNVSVGRDEAAEEAFGIFDRTDLADLVNLLLVTDDPSFSVARSGMQIGASDCFTWPADRDRLEETLRQHGRDILAAVQGDDDIHSSGRGLLQGESQAMQRVYRMLRKVAPTQATVLLNGESGTGKELIARTLHELSDRGDKPFSALNCGAIASDLVESELFGHAKGAFTGAHASHKGFFERTRGGTLLLDEITEMNPELQVKLLRVLETRTIRPVGGEKDIDIDVRIIASTNRDPEQAVEEGSLREDLYFRLAEFPIRVPPLRERGDDIVLLAEHFLQELNRREGQEKTFEDETLEVMRLHHWPGNVRELRNAVSRGFILATDAIGPDDLPGNIVTGGEADGDYLRFRPGSTLKEVERRMILATLEHFEGDKTKTAEALGVSVKTLYNRLQAYQKRPDA